VQILRNSSIRSYSGRAVSCGRVRYYDGLAEFLAAVLKEWIVRNPGRSLDDTNLAAILPEALDESIWKHLGDT
jgi:hypothetical protein